MAVRAIGFNIGHCMNGIHKVVLDDIGPLLHIYLLRSLRPTTQAAPDIRIGGSQRRRAPKIRIKLTN